MGSKIAWRPKVPLWSDGIITPRRPNPGARLGVAVLLCGLAAVSAYSVYLELASEGDRASTAAQVSSSRKPTLVVAAEAPGQTQSSGQSNLAPGVAEMARTIAETTRSADALLPSPSAADTGAETANADAAPAKAEQPDSAKRASKSPTAKKKPTRSINTAEVFTLPDGRQVIVHRPGGDASTSFGGWNGFWGSNDFGINPAQPIHAARPRAFGWR